MSSSRVLHHPRPARSWKAPFNWAQELEDGANIFAQSPSFSPVSFAHPRSSPQVSLPPRHIVEEVQGSLGLGTCPPYHPQISQSPQPFIDEVGTGFFAHPPSFPQTSFPPQHINNEAQGNPWADIPTHLSSYPQVPSPFQFSEGQLNLEAGAFTHPSSDPFQPWNHLATDAFARSFSAASDSTLCGGQFAMLLERDDKVERAVRTRATNKEDQGGKGHTWAELLNIDRPTHDALRWAEEYSDVYLVRDIFPSRQPQDVDLVVDAGINLYALEHEGRPELKISAPDSRRTLLNAINHNRSNDTAALETQIVLRTLGFLKHAHALEPNLLRMSRWFGNNFDFVDFSSPGCGGYSRAVLLITKRICKRSHIFVRLLLILRFIPVCIYRYTAVLLVYLVKCLTRAASGKRRELFDGAFPEMDEVLNKFKSIDPQQFLSHSQTLLAELGTLEVSPTLALEFDQLLAFSSML